MLNSLLSTHEQMPGLERKKCRATFDELLGGEPNTILIGTILGCLTCLMIGTSLDLSGIKEYDHITGGAMMMSVLIGGGKAWLHDHKSLSLGQKIVYWILVSIGTAVMVAQFLSL